MRGFRNSGSAFGRDESGFILLPVALALGLIASVAYLSNRDSGSNVAMVAGRSDAEKARYAAEAGLEHATYLVQQSNCLPVLYPLVTNPVGSSDFGGASYSAHVALVLGNQLELTSTGSYNGASATLVRRNVRVHQTAVQSQTLQPGPGDAQSSDTHVSKQHQATNYGGSTRLLLKEHPNHVAEALIRFVIPVAAGARLVDTYDGSGKPTPGAQLSLFQVANAASTSGTTPRIEVAPFLVQTDWSSNGATWDRSNGSTPWPASERANRPAVAGSVDSDLGGWKSWNVIDAAQAWIGNRRPNYGLWLVASGGNKELEYVSREESSALAVDKRPKLTLNYLAPCP